VRTVRIRVKRLNPGYTDRNLVHAPRFPKPQQESWFIMVTDSAEEKVLGLQRTTLSGNREGNVELEIPSDFNGEKVKVKVLSDGWRGVDVEELVSWQSEKSESSTAISAKEE